MTDHLSNATLNALVDGELSVDQLTGTNLHLAECPACTSRALNQSLLKSASAKAGQRYVPSPHLQERLVRTAFQANAEPRTPSLRDALHLSSWSVRSSLGWAAAAALLLVCVSLLFVQRGTLRAGRASTEQAALVTEVLDQHVATLADSQPLQVISSDRHTVKPWFQGKLPFSFNLPQNLPSDTTLDGANLTYLGNQPVAQLLYSIGKHRVSVFLRQQSGKVQANEIHAERSGFCVMGVGANGLEVIAISDVDPVRLAELAGAIEQANSGGQKHSK